MNKNISLLIETYLSTRREEDFEPILSAFKPLINRYAKKLYYLDYEDCVQELSLEIYLILPKINKTNDESSCLSYIKKAVVHKFCKLYSLSVQEEAEKSISTTDSEFDISYQDTAFDDVIFRLDMTESIKLKTATEKMILTYLIQGYHDSEISQKMGISRQYVNRIKKNLLDR